MHTILTTTVEIANDEQPHGAGRTYEIDAQVIDHGADWKTDEEAELAGATARYALVTHGFVERFGAGGAILGRDPDGDAECQWFDEQPAATVAELERFVRAEWKEFGRDPFAAED